ncbi:4-diphosphocytidyl-2-C-methyl-D-erythritol kinase [bacterium BMS3Abin09]|nr:4-diphosphocytidyl-2-C-methyl-D-erythritol kinase [bacterium BMS3Abin09]
MLTLNAPAKINWFLKVLGLRDDGFHEIRSLIQKVTLYDQITFAPADTLSIETDIQISLEDNLIYKAALLLQKKCGIDEGAVIGLDKNIPMGAGLGGGSSDAAAALIGLNKLWTLGLATEELLVLAKQLGSDVPFFLHGPISFISGRGENIVPRNALKTLNILLVKPPFDIPTAWAYKKYSHMRSAEILVAGETALSLYYNDDLELTKKAEKVNNIEHFIRNIERADPGDITDDVFNDLESVVIESFPVIAEIKMRLREQGAGFVLMSGSGSTVFGVFDSREKAEEALKSFQGFWTAAVETVIEVE